MQQFLGYFLFAAFTFVLVLCVLYLHDRLKRSRYQEEGGNLHEKEMRLFKLYQNLEDMLAVLDQYVEETTTELAREREEIQMMMQRMKIDLAEAEARQVHAGAQSAMMEEQKAAALPAGHEGRPATGPRRKRRGKVEEVRRLHTGGMPEDLIAKELNLSRGEVSLILGMLNN